MADNHERKKKTSVIPIGINSKFKKKRIGY